MKNKFKILNTEQLQLKTDKIDLWQYKLDSDPALLANYLNADEQQRANRYYFAKHKRRFTNARGMLRVILARYLDTHPSLLCFNENQYGKPALENNHILQFNLSHSADLALLAVCMHTPIGVDLEYFSERPFDGIASHMFSEIEIQEFSQIDQAHKQTAFYHVWAQKEAFIKACGLGLAYPTQQFSVPVTPNQDLHQITDSLHNTIWNMQSFMPNAQCYGAICYATHIREIYYGIL